MLDNNVISYETFNNKRKLHIQDKAENLLENIIKECIQTNTELNEDILKTRFRKTGLEDELISIGLWDKSMANE